MNPAESMATSTESTGSQGTAAWLAARGILPPRGPWQVTIVLADQREPTTELHLTIDVDGWGVRLLRADWVSSIRVLESQLICERDDFELRSRIPPLRDLSRLVDAIEDRFGISFRTAHSKIMSTLPSSENKIRLWVVAAL